MLKKPLFFRFFAPNFTKISPFGIMNSSQIESNLQQLIKSFNKDTFIYNLLLAYDQPKASITRLQKGGLNLSKERGEIAWKKKLFFKSVTKEDLHELIEDLKTDVKATKHDPRFIIVTDFKTLLAIDRKTTDTLDIPILEIPRYYDFFLPWAGMEKSKDKSENPADVKAAYQMAKLFDAIKKDNPIHTSVEAHNLNVFLSRMLFCFFAEDTGIFPKGLFTRSIDSHTQQDGSDLNTYLDKLFNVMNTEKSKRKNLPEHLEAFPYVNGGLYQNKLHAPIFTRQSRKDIIKSGDLNWSDINPDIFGSMMQAVVLKEDRGVVGMHYTSVPNIMKVIKPLFLDELYEEFEFAKNEPRRLQKLLERISNLKIFDPACGSGNFLIITYKELRILEMKILQQLQELQRAASGFEPKQLELIPKAQQTLAASFQLSLFSRIQVSQFYGIELDDFAHEIAILSLWLSEHQMNIKFNETFKVASSSLPLKPGGNIKHGNATRLDWEIICSKKDGDEIYIIGNPPYLGFLLQSKEQKEDMQIVFDGSNNFKKLDYISCWFYIASSYVRNSNSSFAFVSTNSLCQGEQVDLLWPLILKEGLEISFAHTSFKWNNNAMKNAGVIVIIVGVRNIKKTKKYLYTGKHKYIGENINPYLAFGTNIFVAKRTKSISHLPIMSLGSSPYENGLLLLTREEKQTILTKYPQCDFFIKKFVGSIEFLRDIEKYCLWIEDDKLKEALKIPEIKERLDKIKHFREKSGRGKTLETANTPHLFTENRHQNYPSLIIPIVSSERREYITCGFLNKNIVIPNSARMIYNPDPWIFALISSLMHIVWVKTVAGRLKSDFRYSASLCYNTFPFPTINKIQKQELENFVYRIIQERENHSEKTLSQMYDPDKMPQGLRDAHHQLDLAVERCYRSKPFTSDLERLEYLFNLYEQMITEERERNGELIFDQPKTKKRKK